MHEIYPVSRQDLIKRLRRLGATGPFQGRRHQYMIRGDNSIIIPNPHHGERIGIELLARILRDGCISRDEWLSSDS